MADNQNLVAVFKPYDDVSAGLIRGAMEDAGIACCIQNECMASAGFGGAKASSLGGMTVLVQKNRAEEALELINRLGFK